MSRYYPAESAKLVFSGNDYFDILENIINEAKETIHIQTYIFEKDETGRTVIASLQKAFSRGVQIFVLADAYGSKSLTKKDIEGINANGIHFRLFSPFFSSESIYMGRRLHHKIVVIDKKVALVGGINIADKYHGSRTETAWLDYAVLLKGSICEQLNTLCDDLYKKKKRSATNPKLDNSNGQTLIRLTRNDWVKGKNEIHKNYLNAVKEANESLIFIASYFLPGYRFRKALKKARRRGVSITIILAGKSDMPFLFYAEKYLYPFFLQHGIKILEWRDSVMHAKAVIADHEWCTIGSYNLNPVSQYLSIELNVEIKDQHFSDVFRKHIREILDKSCAEITQEKHGRSSSVWSKIRNAIMYHFFKFIFLIFIPGKK
ncbi:MAG: cardiolipin synthase ClsB [Bacteroidetes bacterium]|nr:cardiolipin synthase ClsB [Bacteroidota bacterium]